MSHGEVTGYCTESRHHANTSCTSSSSSSRPAGKRRPLSSSSSSFQTMRHWQWRVLHWLACVALVWALSSTTGAVTLPVAMPPSHPKYFLTVAGQDNDSHSSHSSGAALSSNRVPVQVQGKEVKEDEVMYHFYKNGRLGSRSYRKASTVFMVRLFNNLIRGLAPVPSSRRASLGRRTNSSDDEEDQPVTDTIRSFSAKEVKYSKKKKATVCFFVPFLPPNERLRSAEIRFLRRSGGRKKNKRRRKKKRYKLRIDVVRNGRVVKKVMLRERAVIQQDYDVFDVTRILDSWINSHHGNVSLNVRIPRKLERSILLSDASLKSTSLVALYLEDSEFLKNMYESYTTDDLKGNHSDSAVRGQAGNADVNSHSRSRGKRASVGSRANRDSKRRKNKNKNKKRWYRAPKHEKCQMYDFKVDFEFIGWGQWIIHPKNFNARFCYGECPSPVDSKYKPTNHAMLQTLMRQKKRRLAPPTCCVPIKLKPLSMMYFEYEEIVVRHHENMIADECGCR